jgi:hypothetical protein
VGTHEKNAYIGCNARTGLRWIIGGLPKTSGYNTGNAVHKRARNAVHKRPLTGSAGQFSPPAAFLSRCVDCFVSLNKTAAGQFVLDFFKPEVRLDA